MEHNPTSAQTVDGNAMRSHALAARQPSSPAPLKVLAADHNAVIRESLVKRLTSWGYAVVTAGDGPEALAALEQSDGPSLAILDWSMPGMEGAEIRHRIRQAAYARPIYIILIAAPEQKKDAIEALKSIADDYLEKPCHPGELLARLEVGARISVQKALRDSGKSEEAPPRHSEALFRAIAENASDLILVVQPDGLIRYSSPSCGRLLGYGPDELRGTSAFDVLLHPDDRQLIRQKIELAIQSGIAEPDQARFRHKDGSLRTMESFAGIVRGANGEIEQFVVTSRIIDDRLAAEIALHNAHHEAELFFNSVPSILIGLDANRRITRWNLAAADTFGLDRKDVQGKPLSQCGIQWLDKGIEAEIGSWPGSDGSHRCENVAWQKAGKVRFLSLTVSRVNFSADVSPGLLIAGADITEKKDLELQLRQAHRLEAIGQLAAGIAHEINTPIQYVSDNTAFIKSSWIAAARLLSAGLEMRHEHAPGATVENFDRLWDDADVPYLQKEVPRAIDEAMEGIGRVAKIVRAMKEFSHPGSEEKRPFDINHALETTITVARNEWKYVAEVKTSFDTTLPLVPCLVGEFNQAVLNIIVNAAHAIESGVRDTPEAKGVIDISTRFDGEWAEVRIQDNGPGIPEEIRSRVFDPFFTTKAVGRGTGQGLPLAHAAIVKKHGGQLWFESETGKGTVFVIRLPLDGRCPIGEQ